MKLLLSRLWAPIVFVIIVFIFFKPFFLDGRLPIPSDTIVGMYHPWRDFYARDYPQGIPFKNFLITDPVRQQYVWRSLAVERLKKGELPLWNPYNFSGYPLLANFQSASFYPLNTLFFIFSFNMSWSFLVIMQSLLGGLFLFFYLRNLKVNEWGSLLGSIVFSFSGFSIAWLEWNTVVHTALWLPLVLLSIDKVLSRQLKYKKILVWNIVFIFSLTSSFLAGHLQTFFYIVIFSLVYLLLRWWQFGKNVKIIALFVIGYLLAAVLTSVQWLPTFQFINLSARTTDLLGWREPGWFLPWQNLIQFLIPDFFGNPATLNYWGIWNYAEFVGYIGIVPLIFAVFSLLWRRDKKTLFFGSVVLISLIFTLPTPLAKLPYQLNFPLISTSQPTRLLFLIDFSLSVLTALGFDWYIKHLNQLNRIIKTIFMLGFIFCGLWLFCLLFKTITPENLSVAKRNLILPSVLFTVSSLLLLIAYLLRNKRGLATLIYIAILGVTVFDLFRFGWKFTPFTRQEWLFPQTETIKFLQNQPKPFRFMTTDRRIFPPNFSAPYGLEDVSGYDPLYLVRYAELIAAWDSNGKNNNPSGFNRILTPQDFESKLADLLNVKYILSLNFENSKKLKLVFQEGQTKIYENLSAYPRAFFVNNLETAGGDGDVLDKMFSRDLKHTAIIKEKLTDDFGIGEVKIMSYEGNKIILQTDNQKNGFLVVSNIYYEVKNLFYYPVWKASIDGKSVEIIRTDYDLIGLRIPKGKHEVEIKVSR